MTISKSIPQSKTILTDRYKRVKITEKYGLITAEKTDSDYTGTYLMFDLDAIESGNDSHILDGIQYYSQ